MKALTHIYLFLAISFVTSVSSAALAQQPTLTEKEKLALKFRQLTGADKVNLAIDVSFEDVKNTLVASVDNDVELTDTQKQELRKSALDAYDRLDKQLKEFLRDEQQITKMSEAAVFQVYDQTFSETELRDLIAFYSTSTGQKALQFLRTLSTQVQTTFQSMILPKVQEFIGPKIKIETEQLKQRIQQSRPKKT